MENNSNNGRRNEPIRRYKQKSSTAAVKTVLAFVMVAVIIAGVAIYIMSATGTGLFHDKSSVPEIPDVTESDETVQDEETSHTDTGSSGPDTSGPGEDTEPADEYIYIDRNAADTGKGDLVLIDENHPYTFPPVSIETLYKIKYDNKIKTYLVANAKLSLKLNVINAFHQMMEAYARDTGFTSVLVNSAYRDYETQKKIHDKNPKGAPLPGCSDYHSGATFYLAAYVDDKIYDLPNISEAKCEWFKEHMAAYGFIFRFPLDKKGITGYYIPWQIRYVGTPHATYMKANNLCLEEYLELLADKYRYGGEHLMVDGEDGFKYEIFYVAGSAEGITRVPVPSHGNYTLSGDNKGGFIVSSVVGEVVIE